jgi:hypothetical protein
MRQDADLRTQADVVSDDDRFTEIYEVLVDCATITDGEIGIWMLPATAACAQSLAMKQIAADGDMIAPDGDVVAKPAPIANCKLALDPNVDPFTKGHVRPDGDAVRTYIDIVL